MKIVVFGPFKRTGALHGESVVDLSRAYAKYLQERTVEPNPLEMADVVVPSDLVCLIEGGPRALEAAQQALDYLFGEAQNNLGPRGERLVHRAADVRLHAPRPNNARIACAGGNFADHAAAMAVRMRGKPYEGDAYQEIRNAGFWGFWKLGREIVGPTKATRVKFGRIDILVNNAGIGPGAIRPDSWQRPLKFWEITPDQWRRFVAVHTTAPLALTNAVVPEMMRQGWGRIVNVTTSLGTMINPGLPTYGPSKAALEALSAIMAKDLDGTGVTVNVLVPGGITNTPMVSESGFDRAQMIQPEVMVPPLLWLVSDAAGKVTGRRFLGVHWDPELPPEQAAEKAGAPVAWTSIATMPITPSRS